MEIRVLNNQIKGVIAKLRAEWINLDCQL